jgi:glucose-1-phosphate cytidylyltransferase
VKVVLFCGGYGMRMRHSTSDDLPKPMHLVGPRPLLWHIMRYYAHFGHRDFVLCLGYGAQYIKDFFLTYSETASNDFVLRQGMVELLSSDIGDWNITFVHTGRDSSIGERLRRVRQHVAAEEIFLANYADVLTDSPLDEQITRFVDSTAIASMMTVPPQSSFHCVDVDPDGMVDGIVPVSDFLPPGDDLVTDACGELAKRRRLMAYPYRGFWQPADTVKERFALDTAFAAGERPWMLWERG